MSYLRFRSLMTYCAQDYNRSFGLYADLSCRALAALRNKAGARVDAQEPAQQPAYTPKWPCGEPGI